MNADFAGLFLWDEDRELNILRAQYRWHEPQWVDAAHYHKGDTWTGSAALAGQPRYIPDLHKFYEDQGYLKRGSYNRQIFGEELSDDFTVEAIGLPLKAEGEQIGVVTLYRRANGGCLSGFLTTDIELLQESANNLAVLIRLIESNRQAEWEKEELLRQRKVYEAFAAGAGDESFARRVCRRATEAYQAISADFYLVDSSELPPQIAWETGYRADSKAELRSAAPDEMVRRAASVSQSGERGDMVLRYKATDEELKDPRRAGANRSINRVCVPLVYEEDVVGLLDLKWSPEQANYRHSKIHLQLLGEVVGAAYSQHKVVESRKQAERLKAKVEIRQKQVEMELDEQTERAAKSAGAYAIQSLHRLTNVIQAIYSHCELTRKAKSEKEKEDGFNDLNNAIRIAMRIVESDKKTRRRTVFPNPRKCLLVDLINQALKEINEIEAGKLRGIEVNLHSLDGLSVIVDFELMKEVFVNLIDNAANAMKGKKERKLTIALKAVNTKSLEVSIKDTGKGMTNEELRAALGGFITTKDYKGIGVLISRIMLNVQGGALHYTRYGSPGTEAVVTLPSEHAEATL